MSYVFIGLGANLTPAGYLNPRDGCEAALVALREEGVFLEQISNWYETAPVPISDQPWYLNAVARATTSGNAAMTLAALHRIGHSELVLGEQFSLISQQTMDMKCQSGHVTRVPLMK